MTDPDTPTVAAAGDTVEVVLERPVPGGVCLAHEDVGRVVLVEGGVPGETVRVRLGESRPRMARGRVTEVVHPSPDRVVPPCPELLAGCGGCDLQHTTHERQRALKVDVVRDALARIGKLDDVDVAAGEYLAPTEHRTVLRCAVDDQGRAGLRRRRSNDVHALSGCLVAHPWIDQILAASRFPGATEVVIRVGARTGERLVVVTPSAAGATVPDGVAVVGADEVRAGATAWIHEAVARRRFRISAGSFFQARPDGAEALVRAVQRALSPFDPTSGRLADLYGGVGLFTAGLGATDAVLVERSASSIADARVNLAPLGTRIVQHDVVRWRPDTVDAVVVDPARAGLGAEGVAAVAATGAEFVALVSCDPASLGRDARLLADAGYRVDRVELVDMFPHTHHVEAVTTLRRHSSS